MNVASSTARKILVIEDDREMIDLLTMHLTAEGYQVDAAADGVAGLRAFQAGSYGMVLLDWMLPSLSGIDVLREIRALDTRTPVLMLTARSEETDKVLGLELGCDDYLTKPFSMASWPRGSRCCAGASNGPRSWPGLRPEIGSWTSDP